MKLSNLLVLVNLDKYCSGTLDLMKKLKNIIIYLLFYFICIFVIHQNLISVYLFLLNKLIKKNLIQNLYVTKNYK
jgi:hypothetical protein